MIDNPPVDNEFFDIRLNRSKNFRARIEIPLLET